MKACERSAEKVPLATITFILTPTTPGMLFFSRKDQGY